jgi:hypothetical protein
MTHNTVQVLRGHVEYTPGYPTGTIHMHAGHPSMCKSRSGEGHLNISATLVPPSKNEIYIGADHTADS